MKEEHWTANRTVNVTGHALVPPIEVWFGSVPADNRTLQMLNHKSTGFRIAVPAQTAGLTRYNRTHIGRSRNLSPCRAHPLLPILFTSCSLFVHTAYGNAQNAWMFSYFNRVVVTSITTPSSSVSTATAGGSAAGGTPVVLTGLGFSPTLTRNVVTFGSSGATAVVVQANYTHLVVQVTCSPLLTQQYPHQSHLSCPPMHSFMHHTPFQRTPSTHPPLTVPLPFQPTLFACSRPPAHRL